MLLVFLPSWGPNESTATEAVGVNTTHAPSKETSTIDITEEYLQSLLPEFTVQGMEKSRKSPQAQAFHWTMQDPHLQSYPEWRILQRFALACLYFSSKGPNWIDNAHWLSYNVSECDWFTVDHVSYLPTYNTTDTKACHGPNDNGFHQQAYKHLWLWENNLVGVAPPELFYMLTSLYSLDVSENANLGGTLPLHIHRLSHLECLDITVCSFTGTVPTQIGLLRHHLSAALNLGANSLTGQIPSQIGLLTQLTNIVSLWQNLWTGTFPTEMWSLNQLNILAVSYNEHFDPQVIPTDIANLHSMTWLDLRMTMLEGSLPSELGLLSNMEILRLGSNALTGTLPSELGALSTLLQISAKNSNLYGSIPPQLFQGATNLQILDFGSSQLSASIPTEIGLCTSMKILSLSSNGITEHIPSEIGRLSEIGTQALGYLYGGLDLSYNALTGSIPEEIANLSGLAQREFSSDFWAYDGSTFSPTYLRLNNNELTGSLPRSLAQQLTELNILDLSVNNLSGRLPSEIGQWSHLMTLNVAHNPLLGGNLPEELGLYALNGTLTTLNISNTAMEGGVPEGICYDGGRIHSLGF